MLKGGMAGMMKQAQKMQEQMQAAQAEVARMEVPGESGAGLVKVVMNGAHELRRVTIDPAILDDKEMLEDLVVAAVNDAVQRVERQSQELMSKATAGMPLPPGMKLPF